MMSFKKIRIVTDSTADMPQDVIEHYGIGVVPAYVNYGGGSYADDGIELDRGNYYNLMRTMTETPTTSAASSGLSQQIIEQTFEGADHLIILTAPASLSGLHNSMRLGAANLPQDQVTLLDSGQLSAALGWQVRIACEVAEKTGDVLQVLEAVRKVRNHQALYAGLETLEYLRRSGRVSWATAGIGTLLNIKPIISVKDGEVFSYARVRTFSRMVNKLEELVREMAPLSHLAIIHADNLKSAEELRERISDIAPDNTYITMVNPAVGTHIGPGAVGVAPVSANWRS